LCKKARTFVLADAMAEKDDGNWARFLGIGFEIAVGVGLGYVIGNYADHHMGTGPWGLIVGVIVGCFAGMYLVIKEVIKMNKD
jgi:F0F1-type ATP synthase assembly protein I